jgi:hypothetical protein
MTHGSAVPGSTTSGGSGPSNVGGSGAANPTGVGGAESSAGAGGSDPSEGGAAGAEPGESAAGSGGASDQCAVPIRLACGNLFNHSTLIQGRPNTWSGYSSTQRGESGRETLYGFSSPEKAQVTVHLFNLHTDLDLLLVPRCDSISSSKASSTPLDLQTEETLEWTSQAGESWYVVVDGYAGAEGEYTIGVDCVFLGQ